MDYFKKFMSRDFFVSAIKNYIHFYNTRRYQTRLTCMAPCEVRYILSASLGLRRITHQCTSLCGTIPYVTASRRHIATSRGLHSRRWRDNSGHLSRQLCSKQEAPNWVCFLLFRPRRDNCTLLQHIRRCMSKQKE